MSHNIRTSVDQAYLNDIQQDIEYQKACDIESQLTYIRQKHDATYQIVQQKAAVLRSKQVKLNTLIYIETEILTSFQINSAQVNEI